MSTQEVTDSTGRKFVLRELSPGDMLDLLEAAEGASSNGGWVRYASVCASVDSIDGVPMPRPRSKAQVRQMAEKIGNAGLVAIMGLMYPTADTSPAAGDISPEAAEIKN
jgi:hypothetical protein